MKKASIRFILVLLSLAFILFCDKDGSKKTIGPGDFPNAEEELNKLDYFMEFYIESEELEEIWIASKDTVYTSNLIINGSEIPLSFYQYDWDSFFPWEANIELDDLLPDIVSGDKITYSFSINEKNFSGSLDVVYEPNVYWPESFTTDSDFSFNWTLEKSPYIQLCNFWIGSSAVDTTYDWELKGSIREFTIQKKYFDDFRNWTYAYIYLDCYNYKNHGECFVFSNSYDAVYFDNYLAKPKQIPEDRKKHVLINLIKILGLTF